MFKLAPAALAAVTLMAQSDPGEPPKPPPLLGLFSSGCGAFERLEAVVGPQGTIEVRYDGQVFRVFPQGSPKAIEWVQPFSALTPLENRPKWQGGRAWFKSGTRVGCMDPATQKTVYPFAVDRKFDGFEITFEGDLLLTGTEENWLELHSAGREEPRFTQATAPMGRLKVNPGFRWMDWTKKGKWSTSVFNQYVVLMDHDLGRLYAFDCMKQSILEIEAPWQSPMTMEDPPVAAFKASGRQYVLNQGVPGLNCIQFIPRGPGELAVIWRVLPVPEATKSEFDPRNLAKVLEIKAGTWEGTVDFDSHRIKDIHPLEGVELPAWYDAVQQQWVGANAFFAPYLPKKDKIPAKRKLIAPARANAAPLR